jgi:hypothetical protein
MARKKTPPEYGESDCGESQLFDTIPDHPIVCHKAQIVRAAGMRGDSRQG